MVGGAFANLAQAIQSPLPAEQRKEHAQHDAEDDASDDWEIKRGMLTLDPNISGQTPQPFRREPAPHRQTHERDHDTNDDCKLPKLAHIAGESCAN